MNGIKYYRCKNRMTVSDLGRASGVNLTTISRLEKKIEPTSSLDLYIRLSEALGVTVDDLLIEYDGGTLRDGDHPTAKRQTQKITNCIDFYRREENLTFQQLAARMGGVSRQRAKEVCTAEKPSLKTMALLAEHEGISREEFERRYAVPERRCA